MASGVIRSFSGVKPRLDSFMLTPSDAQIAIDCKLLSGALRPLAVALQVLIPNNQNALESQATNAIYRFGQSVTQNNGQISDTEYWFTFPQDVNVVRTSVADDVTERTYWTDGVLPKITDNTLALTGGGANPVYPINYYQLAVPTPVAPPTVTVQGTVNQTTVEFRTYVYTYVNSFGHESQPSPPTTVTEVTTGQTVLLTAFSTAPSGQYDITAVRIYRSAAGSSGNVVFRLVNTVDIPYPASTYTDAVLTVNLSDIVLPSLTWAPPVSNMVGLTDMPNGMLAGFFGKTLCFAAPYYPHAWPVGYQYQYPYPIVGIAAFGSNLLVCTTGKTYICSGVDPSAMTSQEVDIAAPGVSKLSMAEVLGGVAYASTEGIAVAGVNGPAILTQAFFTRLEWQYLNPSSIKGCAVDGYYVGFYDSTPLGSAGAANINAPVKGGFILDLRQELPSFTFIDFWASAVYRERQNGYLYFLGADSTIYKWEGSAPAVYNYTWVSRPFVFHSEPSIGVFQVHGSHFPVNVTVTVDGNLVGTYTANSIEPIRIDPRRGTEWVFRFDGNAFINEFLFAETMQELERL